MAFPTWNPPRAPQLGSRLNIDQKTRVARFGDGYEQVAGDGLNTIRRTWTLVWNACPNSDADAIEAFWVQQGRTLPFWYTAPGTAQPYKWRFETFNRTQIDGNSDQLEITIRQVFDREA
jgi:phage-related protein